MAVENATQFVTLVENTLGWEPNPTVPLWKARMVAAKAVKRRVASNPTLYTWRNLELAVELLRRERKEVRSPIGVFYHVERAVAAAAAQVVTSDIAGQIHEALVQAFLAGETEWVERLARAQGDARQDLLAEWRARHAELAG